MLLFAIAEKLGGYTVDELAEVMSVSELHEWKAYFEWKGKEREKARKKAKNQSKTQRRPR